MKKMILIGIVLSLFVFAGVSFAGNGQILFADQDKAVGDCYVSYQGLLLNGDFEDGSAGWYEWRSPGGWTTDIFSHDYESGSSIYIPTPYPYEGSNTHSQGVGTNNVHGGIAQYIHVIEGTEYTVSGVWSGGVGALNPIGNTAASWFEVTVYDGYVTEAQIDAPPGPDDVIIAKKEWSSAFPGDVFTFGWEEFEGTFIARSDYITLALKTGKVGDWSAIAAYHDNLNIEPTQVCVQCNVWTHIYEPPDWVESPWCGDQAKLDAGVEIEPGIVNNIPQTKNFNPIPGKFEVKVPFVDDADGIDNFDECPRTLERTCFDTASVCTSGNGPVALAVHTGVYSDLTDETAWLAECLQYGPDGLFGCQEWGTDFAGKNWATYVHVPCYTGLRGICAQGLVSCEGGEVLCKGPDPVDEICDDGRDNDCDGLVDSADGEDCATEPECPCWDEESISDMMDLYCEYWPSNCSGSWCFTGDSWEELGIAGVTDWTEEQHHPLTAHVRWFSDPAGFRECVAIVTDDVVGDLYYVDDVLETYGEAQRCYEILVASDLWTLCSGE